MSRIVSSSRPTRDPALLALIAAPAPGHSAAPARQPEGFPLPADALEDSVGWINSRGPVHLEDPCGGSS